eukprot:13486624-Alexandrium_andersonii.AAC.1
MWARGFTGRRTATACRSVDGGGSTGMTRGTPSCSTSSTRTTTGGRRRTPRPTTSRSATPASR